MTEDEMVGWHSVDMSLSKVWKTVKDREAWHPAVLRDELVTEQQSAFQAGKLQAQKHGGRKECIGLAKKCIPIC